MKRKAKKLSLAKETLVGLSSPELVGALGGTIAGTYSSDWKDPWVICMECDSSGC